MSYTPNTPETFDNGDDDSIHSAYNAGFRAGKNNKPAACPEQYGDQEQSWLKGWQDGDEVRYEQQKVFDKRADTSANEGVAKILRQLLANAKNNKHNEN